MAARFGRTMQLSTTRATQAPPVELALFMEKTRRGKCRASHLVSNSMSAVLRGLPAFFAAIFRVFLRTVFPAHLLRFRLELAGCSFSCRLRLLQRGLDVARGFCRETAKLLHALLIVIECLLYEVRLGIREALRQLQIVIDTAVPKVDPCPVYG